MLRNIFTKTLYERKIATVIWTIAITGFSVMIISLFPTFRDTFGEALQNVPDNMRSLLGEANSYRTIDGYIDTILFSRIVFLTLIMGIVMATGLMSGEESDGRLQTLLAQPVSRTTVYLQKFLAMSLAILLPLAGLVLGVTVGTLIVGEISNIDYVHLLEAAGMIWLLTMTFASLAFCIGAVVGKKGIAGLVAGFLAFTLFLVNSLAGTATILKSIDRFSPFKYYNSPGILEHGVSLNNILILGAAVIVLAVIGWVVFIRRDVYQK